MPKSIKVPFHSEPGDNFISQVPSLLSVNVVETSLARPGSPGTQAQGREKVIRKSRPTTPPFNHAHAPANASRWQGSAGQGSSSSAAVAQVQRRGGR